MKFVQLAHLVLNEKVILISLPSHFCDLAAPAGCAVGVASEAGAVADQREVAAFLAAVAS